MTPPHNAPKLDGFDFLQFLGGGGFGEVWLARDRTLNVFRAVKVLPKGHVRASLVRRLVEEAQKLARLPKHRNQVQVFLCKDGITNCFLVMEYVAGGPLSRLTSPERPLPWGRAARYVAGV